MNRITGLLASMGFDVSTFWGALVIFAAGTILLGAVGRFAFGKRSTLNHCVSSAISILFVYAATMVLYCLGARYQAFIAPLPFVTVTGSRMDLFSFFAADYTIICAQLLSMIILAFLANLVDGFLPRGSNLISWFFFRVLTVALAMAAHLAVDWLFTTHLPQGLVTYAPTIVLGLLLLLLAVGALRIVIGAALATVNPLVGAFYTFFFATLVGKALSKAVVTTCILSAIILGLNYIGLTGLTITQDALIAYIPGLGLLMVIWYVVGALL